MAPRLQRGPLPATVYPPICEERKRTRLSSSVFPSYIILLKSLFHSNSSRLIVSFYSLPARPQKPSGSLTVHSCRLHRFGRLCIAVSLLSDRIRETSPRIRKPRSLPIPDRLEFLARRKTCNLYGSDWNISVSYQPILYITLNSIRHALDFQKKSVPDEGIRNSWYVHLSAICMGHQPCFRNHIRTAILRQHRFYFRCI